MKILLADDHELVRDTLVMFLESEGLGPVAAVGTATEAERTLAEAGEGRFDIVLLDYDMPGMDGLDGLCRVREAAAGAPVALLSGAAAPSVARRAIASGARGFLPKTMGAPALATAIRLIVNGEIFVPFAFLDQPGPSEASGLTAREIEVLHGLYAGKSNKEIARELNLQEVTVKLHVKTLSRKLGARNRTHAAMIARDRKLITG